MTSKREMRQEVKNALRSRTLLGTLHAGGSATVSASPVQPNGNTAPPKGSLLEAVECLRAEAAAKKSDAKKGADSPLLRAVEQLRAEGTSR